MSHIQLTSEGVYRSDDPISNDMLSSICPPVFAQEPHESRSERYGYVPTIDVVSALRGEGYEVFGATQAGTRKLDKQGFQKHLIRMRRPDDFRRSESEAPELIIINSHDGSSSYQISAGVFRFACANGLVIGDSFARKRVMHTGDIVSQVIEGSYEVIGEAKRAQEMIGEWSGVRLSITDQLDLAAQGLRARGAIVQGDDKESSLAGYDPRRVLRIARTADVGADLWTTFNRVQERVTRGRIRGMKRNANGGHSTTSLRPIRSIDQNTKVNRQLWDIAERIAKAA